jgi:3-methyladenine DNA glycosylase/8-oxoguanine DNA glycosylase
VRLPAGFETDWTLAFLGARAVPGLEAISGDGYGRVIRLDGQPRWFEARFRPSVLSSRIEPSVSPARLGSVARWLFDCAPDLAPFLELARRDPILGPIVAKRPGLRRPLMLDPFEAAVRAIVGQLVSVAAARAVLSRLVRAFGAPLSGKSAAQAFPHPDDLIEAGPAPLARVGMTSAKARSVVALAATCRSGRLDWDALRADPVEADRALRSLPGIGPWTSGYVRWRALGDPDAFPAADLGIVKALAARGVDRAAVTATAERWRPWRAFAVCHLWASLRE